MSEEPLRVLLVDDERSLREPLARYLAGPPHHFHVDPAASAWEALQLATGAESPYDVALIDDLLIPEPEGEPEPIGIDLMREIRVGSPTTECIVVTGWGMDRALEALRAGAYRYLPKPLNREELCVTIRMAAEHSRLRHERDLLGAALQVSNALTRRLDVEQTLQVIAKTVARLTGAESCAVARIDAATGRVRHEPVVPLGNMAARWHRHLRDVDLTRQIIETGETFGLSDVSAHPNQVDEILCQAGVQSFVGVPIPGERQTLGVLYAYSLRPGAFPTREQRVLQLLAGQAGIAIANAQAFSDLAEAKEWRDALIEHAFDAVIGIDQKSKITVFNRRAEEMFGWTTEEMVGQTVARLHVDIEKARALFDVVNRQGEIPHWNMTLKHRNGAAFPAALSATVIRNSQGHPIGQAGFVRNLHTTILLEGRLQALVEVGRAITSTLNLDEVLQLVMASAMAAFPTAHGGSIHLYDERTNTLCMRANTFNYGPSAIEASCLNPDEGIAGWVFQHRQPEVVDDVRQHPRYKRIDHPETPDHKSIICVPLQGRERIIGTLSLDNLQMTGAFRPHDVGLLSTFANQAAIAIENARLYQEAQESRTYIQSLYQAGSAIISSLDPADVLQAVVDTACTTTGAWRALVLIMDEGERARVLAHAGFDHPLEPATTIRARGISRQVIRTGQPRFFPDVQVAAHNVHPRMIEQGTRAAACVPLLLRDRTIGVLWVQFREPHPFSRIEQQALQVYANQSAIAYDNAYRMQVLEHMRKAAEAMAGALEPPQVLRQVVESAAEVLQANSAAIWSYDSVRNQFIPEELAAHGIPTNDLERFRKTEPKARGTADTVMRQGWVGIADISDLRYGFMGASTVQLLTSIGARSFQGTALRVGDEQLGVLYVNYNQPRGFTTEDKRTLETFAHHAALALKKARLLKQVSKAKKAAEVVARVTVLGKGEEPLRSVVDGTREAVGCDAVVLYVYDQSMAKLDHPPTMVGVDFPDQAKRYEEVAPDSIVYTMLRHSGPYIVERIAEDELFSRTRFARDEKIESCVAIPLGLAEQTVGVMFVNYRAYHRFTSNELANIELFANQAAVAIRNAQLYRESQERARVLESLYQAAQIVTRSLSLPDVLQMIAEQAWKLAEPSGEKQAQLSHVALREGNTLSFVAAYPLEHLAGLRSQVGDVDLERGLEGRIGISGRAVKTGQIQRVGRVTEHPDYIRYDEKTRSELAVPLTIDGNAIGVINVEHPDHDAFDEEDEKALKALAAQAAIAIQNARRYEELRKAKGLIGARTALAWMGMASSTWRHAIDKHAVTIREQAQLLRQSWSSLPPPSGDDKAPERLGIIERLATQILDKPITPPLSMEEGLESVALNALVGERARQLWQGDPYSQATLRLDLELADGSTVRASPEWLRRAFELLVDNAVAALTGRPVREVTIGTRQVQGGAEILVCDTGPGIPEDIQAKVGLELIERPEDAMGLGMGLLMAQTVVQTYGGEIRVGTTGPAGTTMVIWLPLEEQTDAGRRR